MDGLSGLFLPRQNLAPTRRVGEKLLSNPSLASVSEEIHGAIQTLKNSQGSGKVLLVIDQLDILLAARGDQGGTADFEEMWMGFREVCHLLKEYENQV